MQALACQEFVFVVVFNDCTERENRNFTITTFLTYVKIDIISSNNLARIVILPVKRLKKNISVSLIHDSALGQNYFQLILTGL